jgi:hypothetical protein
MKTSIATINSFIALKAQNGINGFNFYKWLKDAHVFRPDLSFLEFSTKIAYANITEKTCFNVCSF